MQLMEIVQEILRKKFSTVPEKRRPRALAKVLDASEMDVRRIAGIDPGTRRNQEKIFQITLKILRLCEELKIDPTANSLQDDEPEEAPLHAGRLIKPLVEAALGTKKKQKGQTSARDHSNISPSRLSGGKRKQP